jgi:alpha-tubulin suppressor-like RCC1 family protein
MWGAGANGRLGLGDFENRLIPTEVKSPLLKADKATGNIIFTTQMIGDWLNSFCLFTDVCAGSEHTCILTSEGNIITFGTWQFTGLGDTTGGADVDKPRLVLFPDGGVSVKAVSIGIGGYHTVALTFDNRIYTWGQNRVGQLGLQYPEDVAESLPFVQMHFDSVQCVLIPQMVPSSDYGNQTISKVTNDYLIVKSTRSMICYCIIGCCRLGSYNYFD